MGLTSGSARPTPGPYVRCSNPPAETSGAARLETVLRQCDAQWGDNAGCSRSRLTFDPAARHSGNPAPLHMSVLVDLR